MKYKNGNLFSQSLSFIYFEHIYIDFSEGVMQWATWLEWLFIFYWLFLLYACSRPSNWSTNVGISLKSTNLLGWLNCSGVPLFNLFPSSYWWISHLYKISRVQILSSLHITTPLSNNEKAINFFVDWLDYRSAQGCLPPPLEKATSD